MSGGELSGEQKVHDLVGSIYDAALDGRLWPDALNRIGDAVGGPQVMFGVYDPAIGLTNVLAPRIDPELTRSCVEDWAPRNPLLPLGAGQPPGKVFTCGDFITAEEFTGSAFYQEWWRPAGFNIEPLTTNLLVEGAASGIFTSYGQADRAPFSSDQKRLFAALARHLVRAVALQRRLFLLAIEQESALAGLDNLQQGFLLVDAESRPLFVNRVAGVQLDAGDGLLVEEGALSASDADDAQRLRGLIASCAVRTGVDAGGEVVLRRRPGRLPLKLLVTPVRPDSAIAAIPWALLRIPAAIVLVTDAETEMRARIDSLRARFGFTAAEAAFALEIVKGDGREAAAKRLGIAVGTARSHLSSIFDKTGSRRQAELVRLLLQP